MSPLAYVLDIDTKDAVKAWLRCFKHGEDVYVDIDGYKIEFTAVDSQGHTHKMTMPSIYSERECRMYSIKDLLGEDV